MQPTPMVAPNDLEGNNLGIVDGEGFDYSGYGRGMGLDDADNPDAADPSRQDLPAMRGFVRF